NPDFPSVAFPNPEEPGAMDLALAVAQDAGADVVLANDPDADRCAVAVFDPRVGTYQGAETARSNGWRMLHGDEVGALLGDDVARRVAASGGQGVLACSVVSSRLLGKIAAAHGLGFATTLTGFKWISRVDGLVFGYEEALGYCVDPAHVRDKDGISAALLVAQLANRLKAEGRTLVDALDDLARQHGLHVSDQLSARFTDLDRIGDTMAHLRSAPPRPPAGAGASDAADRRGADPHRRRHARHRAPERDRAEGEVLPRGRAARRPRRVPRRPHRGPRRRTGSPRPREGGHAEGARAVTSGTARGGPPRA